MDNAQLSIHDVQALWRRLPTTPVEASAADLRARADGFRRYIGRRNFKEYAACFVAGVASIWAATWPVSALWHIACGLLALGSAMVAMNLYRRSAPLARREAPTLALIEFHRVQLETERDMLLGMWRWYLLPFIPGTALLLAAWTAFVWPRIPHLSVMLGVACLILLAALVGLWTVTVQLTWAARLQRRIEDLDRYQER